MHDQCCLQREKSFEPVSFSSKSRNRAQFEVEVGARFRPHAPANSQPPDPLSRGCCVLLVEALPYHRNIVSRFRHYAHANKNKMGCCGMSTAVSSAVCISLAAILITAIVLIAVSVKSIDATEVALAVDGFSQTISPKLFPAGTVFLGPAVYLIRYPTTQQTIVFTSASTGSGSDAQAAADGPALQCRTSDGLTVGISFSFNYLLRQNYEDLSGLYINFGAASDVDVLYQRIAKNVVRTIAGNYPASAFFISKEVIRLAMFAALKTDLATQSGNLQAFNLLDVSVPKALSAAISAQQNAQQDVIKAQNDLQTAGINAQSRVNANASIANLIKSGATVTAQQLQQAVTAQIESLQARYAAEAVSYKTLKNALGLDAGQLLSYIWLDAQNDANNKGSTIQTIIKVDGPQILT